MRKSPKSCANTPASASSSSAAASGDQSSTTSPGGLGPSTTASITSRVSAIRATPAPLGPGPASVTLASSPAERMPPLQNRDERLGVLRGDEAERVERANQTDVRGETNLHVGRGVLGAQLRVDEHADARATAAVVSGEGGGCGVALLPFVLVVVHVERAGFGEEEFLEEGLVGDARGVVVLA